MATEKLYYQDCHLRSFSACVTACQQGPDGYWVTLNATAFYPEGGGQACDIGTLGDATVLKTLEKDDEIFHICDRPLPVGSAVTGTIDWERRFDLMQQHTGEHILSGLIFDAFGYHNTGFHVGADVMEVDFDGLISQEDLAKLEQKANQAIWENLPVHCSVPSPEALPAIAYRTKRPLPWPVRIVEIPGCDRCACCGVHVKHTGEVGVLKILSCVKLRQGVRLEMVCGKRAFRYYQEIFEQNKQVSQCFSAQILETGAAARKISDTLAQEKYKTAGLQSQIFTYIAESYVNRENVIHFAPDLSSAQIRQLADAISLKCRGYAAVFSGSDDHYGYCLINQTGEVAALGKALTQALNGRGGGKPNAQQGTIAATKEQIEDFFANN